jgi:hypothetical protein
MLKTFVGVLLLGVALSFHDTLWPWTLICLSIAAGMIVIGKRLEGK